MKHYTFTAPIEIRASRSLEKNPEYVVKGYINANIPDHYGTKNTPFGKKALRSVFTDNAISSMEKQAKAKKIYVDSQHKIATQMNVEHYLDESNLSDADKKRILNEIKISDIPIAKLISLQKDPTNPSRLIADTRLNPSYRNVDESHKSYFDAVWQSMEDKYINGMSFDFAPTKVFEKDGITYIDDLQLYGINYLGGQALPENNLFEVAMRATKEFGDDVKMDEEKLKALETKLGETSKQLEDANEKVKGFENKVEETQKADAEKEKEDLKTSVETMKKELEEMKGKPDTSKKGIVPTGDKYDTKEKEPGLPDQTDKLPTMEELEAIKKFKEILWDNVKVTNRFPTHGDMFKGAPMKINPDGELTLGHLLYLQHDQPDLFNVTVEGMDTAQREALYGMSNTFRHIK